MIYRNLRLNFLITQISNADNQAMRVISRRRLREFWESKSGDSIAAKSKLLAWEKIVKSASWDNWSDLSITYPNADLVGNCIVFNIGGNKYRLIARIMYESERVFVLKVMDHEEYDRRDPSRKNQAKWVDECRCHQPPPPRKLKSIR